MSNGIIEKHVPIILKSGNQLVSWGMRGRFNYISYRNKCYKTLKYYFPHRGDNRPEIKRRVEVIRIMKPKQRNFDPENLGLSIKPVYDFLKHNNYIFDDSLKWCERIYDEQKLKDVQRTHPHLEAGIIVRVWL